jgi:hypothetical protein
LEEGTSSGFGAEDANNALLLAVEESVGDGPAMMLDDGSFNKILYYLAEGSTSIEEQ